MTIDELADLTSEKLKALSDKELVEILSPFFSVTRPELATKPNERKSFGVSKPNLSSMSPQQRAILALMNDEGIDTSFLNRRKKK